MVSNAKCDADEEMDIFSRKKSRIYRHKIDFKMAAISSHKIEENEFENKLWMTYSNF